VREDAKEERGEMRWETMVVVHDAIGEGLQTGVLQGEGNKTAKSGDL